VLTSPLMQWDAVHGGKRQPKIEMRKLIHIAVVTLAVAGCSREVNPPSPLVVVPGVGIPGYVEIGMTVDQVRRKVKGAQVEYYPEIRWPWQVKDYDFGSPSPPRFFQARETSTRSFWQKPEYVEVAIPHLGLSFFTDSDTDPIRSITFWTLLWTPVNWKTWFSGELTCGLSFANGRCIRRDEVVAIFGEPTDYLTYGEVRTSEALQAFRVREADLLKHGKAVSVRFSGKAERLHYPTNGIEFSLHSDKVGTFTIKERVEPGGVPNHRSPSAQGAGGR